MEPIKISKHISEKDYALAIREYTALYWKKHPKEIVFLGIVFVSLVSWGLNKLPNTQACTNPWYIQIPFEVLLGFFVFYSFITLRSYFSRGWIKDEKKRNPLFLAPSTLEFSEEGAYWITISGTHKLFWIGFKGYIETKSFIFLCYKGESAFPYMIPKSSFASAELLDRTIAFLDIKTRSKGWIKNSPDLF